MNAPSMDERERRRVRNRKNSDGAKRRRAELVEELAPDLRCAECGNQFDSAAHLEVDHVDGAGWSHRALSSSARVARYRREHREGVALRALCRSCSGRDGAIRGDMVERAMGRRRR